MHKVCTICTHYTHPFFKTLESPRRLEMKITLTPETVEKLEGLAEKKITRNGDQVIRQVAEMAENADNSGPIEMTVCDNTKKEMEKKDA